jgi:hypothetical protein
MCECVTVYAAVLLDLVRVRYDTGSCVSYVQLCCPAICACVLYDVKKINFRHTLLLLGDTACDAPVRPVNERPRSAILKIPVISALANNLISRASTSDVHC